MKNYISPELNYIKTSLREKISNDGFNAGDLQWGTSTATENDPW